MKYKSVEYNEYSRELFDQLSKGVFMTTKVKDKVNTMTIAWGGINIVWNKTVFVAYVRETRDTYQMLEHTDEFTISVPSFNTLKKELAYCGTKSGRDCDKIKDCALNIGNSRKISTPILSDCFLHYECKVIYRQKEDPKNIPVEVLEKQYPNNDFHVIFYGEIVDSYIIERE